VGPPAAQFARQREHARHQRYKQTSHNQVAHDGSPG
jgi:hypothetical protein